MYIYIRLANNQRYLLKIKSKLSTHLCITGKAGLTLLNLILQPHYNMFNKVVESLIILTKEQSSKESSVQPEQPPPQHSH